MLWKIGWFCSKFGPKIDWLVYEWAMFSWKIGIYMGLPSNSVAARPYQTNLEYPRPRCTRHNTSWVRWVYNTTHFAQTVVRWKQNIRKMISFIAWKPETTEYCRPGRGRALQYQMNTGVRLTLPKAGAFGENTISKNEGSLGEKPNFGSKLGGIGWECYFWSFSERFKSRNLKKKNSSKMAKNDQFVDEIETKSSFLWQPNAKNRRSLGRRAYISPKNVGSLGDSIDNQQKYGVIGWQHWK